MFRKVFSNLFGGKKSPGNEEKVETNPVEVVDSQQNEQTVEDEIPFGNHNLRLRLVPHKHTLFCERKSRVCTAVGKIQELEVVEIYGRKSSDLSSITWYRKTKNGSDIVHENNDRDQYTLDISDIDCFIHCEIKWKNSDTMVEEILMIPDILGPVLPGPSRLLDLRVSGTLEAGKKAIASYKYVGGIEGCSEFWWLKINDGKREQMSEPIAISNLSVISDDYADNDPRVYVIKDEDVGSILKVKCIPVRSDGYRGEIFTSKPSSAIGTNFAVKENNEPRVNSKSIMKKLTKKIVTKKVSQRLMDHELPCDGTEKVAVIDSIVESDIEIILTSYGPGKVVLQNDYKTVIQLNWGVLYTVNPS